MADIHPFRGVRYNQSQVKDLSTVICPPYDIISPEQQHELHLRSEYNFVRIEYPLEVAGDDKYIRSAATLEKWLKQGVLRTDEKQALYLHDHHFIHEGKNYRRRNILARVRLEEWDRMVIRPHEGILPRSRSDRLSLLWACQANTSPILAMYEDKERLTASLLEKQAVSEPVADVAIGEERHLLWSITAPDVIDQVSANFAGEPLYIADGHHRYESALTYRRERASYSLSAAEDNALFDFVMMELVDFADPGLVILPPHRLVRGIPTPSINGLLAKLAVFFDIEELPLSSAGVWQSLDRSLSGSDAGDVKFAVFGLKDKLILVLKLHDFTGVSRMMPHFHSELYKKLDVSIIDHVILEALLELSSEKEEIELGYSHSREDAVNEVLHEEYQLAFLVNPVKATTIKAIADVQDRMPRKSTYFYPKAPAGLVFYRLV